jgi:hypothetical protein
VKALVDQLLTQLAEQMAAAPGTLPKPPSGDGSGFKPPGKGKSKASGCKRGGHKGHPGAGRNLLPSEQYKDVIPHHRGGAAPRLSALVGLLGGAHHLSHRKDRCPRLLCQAEPAHGQELQAAERGPVGMGLPSRHHPPLHFGAALTQGLANYNGSLTQRDGGPTVSWVKTAPFVDCSSLL